MSKKVAIGLSVAFAASASILAPGAPAAIYDVHACRLPSGAPAPAYGWTASTLAISSINCPGGTMTIRTPPGTHSPGWMYSLSFTAPRGTNIAGFRRHVEGQVVQVPGAPPPWSWDYMEGGTVVGEDEYQGIRSSGNMGPLNDSFVYPLERRLSELRFSLQCSMAQNSGPCQDNGSYFSVKRIAVELDDYMSPRVLSSSGSLLAATGPQRGERHLVLKLSDVGSGLYRVRVEVDGERMSELPVDDNQGACKSPFVHPVPCKLAATVDVPVDTTRLTEGRHALHVRVFDATGVNAAVVGPLSIVIDNLPDPPVRGTSKCPTRSIATVTRRLTTTTVRFGRRASMIGRVSAARRLLKGARIGLVDNPSLRERPKLAKIGRHGRFHIELRPRLSTSVRPILVAASGEAAACGKPVRVRVRAGVRLRASRRLLRNGSSISMVGTVAGRPLPAQGKAIAIQARARGAAAWTTVTVLRTDAKGRFAFSYRFRRTFSTTTYLFRAVAPRERGHPYIRGWSRIRRVTVSP